MAVTGRNLYQLFQQNIDKSFTNWTGVAAANRWFRSSYIKTINDIYSERLNNQRAFDQIGYLIALNTVFNVNQTNNSITYAQTPIVSVTFSGTVATVSTEVPHNLQVGDAIRITNLTTAPVLASPFTATVSNVTGVQSFTFPIVFVGTATAGTGTVETATPVTSTNVNDYLHYLYGEATFVTPYYNLKVLTASNTTPIKLQLNKRNKIRSGDKVVIAGIVGNINANGEYYVKELNPSIGDELWNLALYSDINLQTPVVGNGASTSQGTISTVTESKGMKLWLSDQKGALYGQPSLYEPYFQQGKLSFTIYPLTSVCRSVKLDYIRKQPREIDADDDTYNLENEYPYYFLEKIAIEAGRLLSVAVRDGSLNAGLTNEILENN